MKLTYYKSGIFLKIIFCILFFVLSVFAPAAMAATMQDYCVTPPFIAQSVPPLVMFEVGREHKLWHQAYNDAVDLNEDGKIDTKYDHSIDYYGYFDPYKCYTHTGGSGSTAQFNPAYVTATKFCNGTAGHWSGNVLNWLSMARIDVLSKVLYGGRRDSDSVTETTLQRAKFPIDSHSWGKELTGRLCNSGSTYTTTCADDSECPSGYNCTNVSFQLIGMTASDLSTSCSSAVTVSNTNDRIQVVRYYHTTTVPSYEDGDSHTDLLNSYEPTVANTIDYQLVTDFSNAVFTTTTDHYDHYNIIAVAEFNVASSEKGNWQFVVDGDDGVEVELFPPGATATTPGTVVASYYNGHSSCFGAAGVPASDNSNLCAGMVTGLVDLNSSGFWRIVVRHSEKTGQDGVKVWFKKKGATSATAWSLFGSASFGAGNLRAPNITATNVCSVQNTTFIEKGVPVTGVSTAKRHLFCNTTLGSAASDMPLLRVLANKTNRIWEWAAKERPLCDASLGAPTDYTVRVKVCDSAIGLESNCKSYPSAYKPIGLMQKYATGAGSGTKYCSKSLGMTCSSDNNCIGPPDLGVCIEKVGMYFGMFSSSYTNNTDGGVLRKNFGSIADEYNPNNGLLLTSESTQGNIVLTMDRLGLIGYNYTSYSYTDTSGTVATNNTYCPELISRAITDGECRNWGNPVGEMMYESIRYIAGKGAPLTDFTYAGSQDSGISLSKPGWGYTRGSDTLAPYATMPSCARPFILLLSDVNSSYDRDNLPGSYFTGLTEDAATPTLGINVSTLTDVIGANEGIHGNSWFIGDNGTIHDGTCTEKTITALSQVHGICPEEPTKLGTYYSAAVALYGNMYLKQNTTTIPNLSTFVVALSSPVADLKIKAGSKYVTISPMSKSVSGASSRRTYCIDKCTTSYTDSDGLHLTGCAADTFCGTDQLVQFYVEDVRYDTSTPPSMIYAKFRINFENREQGFDYDMDAIVSYEVCTEAARTAGVGSCTTVLTADELEIKLSSDSASGGTDQAIGFVISGTSTDGTYYPVRDKDVTGGAAGDADTPSIVSSLPLTWSKVFTTSGTPTANFLKNPLWYAAKYGGFEDNDGDKVPFTNSTCGTATPNSKCAEWDKDNNGDPDNYFFVANPMKLEQELERAILAILRRASSGTAASVLASGEGQGANLVQALFYPRRLFTPANVELDWIGTLQNFWYYLDPRLGSSSIRVDTTQDSKLKLNEDYIAEFFFDSTQQRTMANLYQDTDGDGDADISKGIDLIENMKTLWDGSKKLWAMSPGDRTMYTPCSVYPTACIGTTNLMSFSTGNFGTSTEWSYLQAADATEKNRIIFYINGYDKFCSVTTATGCAADTDCPGVETCSSQPFRNRTTGIDLDNSGTIGAGETNVWKLGDIVNSTPRIISWIQLNNYDKTYNDSTYTSFIGSNAYKTRGTIVTGANDGMLHAFNLGLLDVINDGTSHKASLCYDSDSDGVCDTTPDELSAAYTTNLGKEQWAFIPKNALPYLKYFTDKTYCHLYYVDGTPFIFDASIGRDTGATNPAECVETVDADVTKGYWHCAKTANSWKTILIGGMRYGGACGEPGSASVYDVEVPVAGKGYSSYFALDVTDPANPKFLWEFSNENLTDKKLGFTTTGPAIMKIKARTVSGGVSAPVSDRNGKWFVVFASGPTGPINSSQFNGYSDQNLRLYILDLKTGNLLRTITMDGTGGLPNIQNAFGASLNNANIDYDFDYQDDALYLGYTSAEDATLADNKWTSGGVIRLVTREDLTGDNLISTNSDVGTTALNPYKWEVSNVATNVGSVTSSIAHLAHYPLNVTKPDKAFLFFGSGRYFYKKPGEIDNETIQRSLFGVNEPCLSEMLDPIAINDLANPVCDGSSLVCSGGGDLATDGRDSLDLVPPRQSFTCLGDSTDDFSSDSDGWFIDLDPSSGTAYAERTITDPLATTIGAVFFTTYAPNTDICTYGGSTYLWAVKYDTGGSVAGQLKGKALLQVSTGSIEEIDLATAFSDKADSTGGGRRSGSIQGVPPTGQGLSLVTQPPPLNKMMHIRKK